MIKKELHPVGWTEPGPTIKEEIARDKVVAKNLIERLTENRSFTYEEIVKLICGYRKDNAELGPFISIRNALRKDRDLLEDEQAKTEPDVELIGRLETAIANHEAAMEARRPLNIVQDRAAAVRAMLRGESVGGVPACKSLRPQEVIEIIEEVYNERVSTYTFRTPEVE